MSGALMAQDDNDNDDEYSRGMCDGWRAIKSRRRLQRQGYPVVRDEDNWRMTHEALEDLIAELTSDRVIYKGGHIQMPPEYREVLNTRTPDGHGSRFLIVPDCREDLEYPRQWIWYCQGLADAPLPYRTGDSSRELSEFVRYRSDSSWYAHELDQIAAALRELPLIEDRVFRTIVVIADHIYRCSRPHQALPHEAVYAERNDGARFRVDTQHAAIASPLPSGVWIYWEQPEADREDIADELMAAAREFQHQRFEHEFERGQQAERARKGTS
jgi:hypothetical protein